MLQPRIPSREVSLTTLATALNNLALCSRHAPKPRCPQIIFTRHASHAAQGRANGPKDSAGRRLGAKKASQEYVIPGNIIFKQRGTKWFPGENVGLGKDHTIFSKVHGYVRYYRNPALHPKRRYIGVALEREGPGSKLPTPHNAPTRRRLGMYAAPITSTPAPNASFLEQHISSNSLGKRPEGSLQIPHPNLKKRTSLSAFDPASPTRTGGHGISNWEIGRAAEFKGVQVKEFDRKDRWTAWRIRSKKMKLRATEAASKKARKNKGKKTNKAM